MRLHLSYVKETDSPFDNYICIYKSLRDQKESLQCSFFSLGGTYSVTVSLLDNLIDIVQKNGYSSFLFHWSIFSRKLPRMFMRVEATIKA